MRDRECKIAYEWHADMCQRGRWGCCCRRKGGVSVAAVVGSGSRNMASHKIHNTSRTPPNASLTQDERIRDKARLEHATPSVTFIESVADM